MDTSDSKPLSAEQAAQVSEQIARAATAPVPFEAALRVVAREAPERRVGRTLVALADELAAGRTLDQALAALGPQLPAVARGLIATAAHSGRFGLVLTELTEHQRALRRLVVQIRSALLYPLCVCLLAAIIVVGFVEAIVPPLKVFLDEMNVQVPWAIATLMDWHAYRGGIYAAVLVAGVAAIVLRRRTILRRFVASLPLVGTFGECLAAAEMSQALRLLLAEKVPLPTALRLTADTLRDRDFAGYCRTLADAVERGRPLGEALAEMRWMPAALAPLVQWGERTGRLDAAFDSAAEIYRTRVETRSATIRALVPPVLFVLLGLLAGTLISVVCSPLMSLVSSLSTFTPSSPATAYSPGPLLLTFFGLAVLWSTALVYSRTRTTGDDFLRRTLTLVGLLSLIIGCLSFLYFLTFPPVGVFLVVVLLGTAVMCVGRWRDTERRLLLHLLGVAAEREIPLDEAARSFALDRAGEMGARAARLADLISDGRSLPVALRRSRAAPVDGLLAAELGTQLGALPTTLRRGLRTWDEIDVSLRPVLEKLLYLGTVLVLLLACHCFLTLKIWPVFSRLSQEFGGVSQIQTKIIVAMAHMGLDYYFVLLPLVVLPYLSLLLSYVGWCPRNAPGLGYFALPVDRTRLLYLLATIVERQSPLPAALSLLRDHFPRRFFRRRLSRSVRQIESGTPWCDALMNHGLLLRSDGAVFHAAERAGNLAWALEQMAERHVRRLTQRIRTAVNIAVPLVVLGLGLLTLFVTWVVVQPLSDIIQSLAP